MDVFEKINRAFGAWYEGLFGAGDDVRPKDILRKIIVALEEHCKEGVDGRVYVPNRYIIELAVEDEEERDYLYSFLDREELEAAIVRYCRQNGYEIRGPLDFTIREIDPAEHRGHSKVRIRCRYSPRQSPSGRPPAPVLAEPPSPDEATLPADELSDQPTVPGVPIATLTVHTADRPPFDVPIYGRAFTIGRSAHAANDLVLNRDGMVSRRHVRLELERDGKFTLYDLDTTNGTQVNGHRVDNTTLNDGDEIRIGATRIQFHQHTPAQAAMPPATSSVMHLVQIEGPGEAARYPIAPETLVGRAPTSDIVLRDASVAMRHALIRTGRPCTVEALDPQGVVKVNGVSVPPGAAASVEPGDRIIFGILAFRLDGEGP
ncbi:MAG: FhaA domain-containing protein [Chthonomonadales bacterium]